MAENTDIIDGEEWRDVPGWPGYRVSSLGRFEGKRGRLNPIRRPSGYLHIPLSDRKNKRLFYAHRLVCAAFLGPIPDGMQVNHINNDRADNRLSNLEYVTAKQNCQHRRNHGTYPTGENNNRAKLTAEQVAEIRRRRALGEKLRPMAAEYGVHQNTIWWITSGKTWVD